MSDKDKKEYVFTPLKKKETSGADGKFLPGVSPNPGGRPKVTEDIRRIAQLRSKEAIELVYGIMVDENQKTSDRLGAIRLILTAAGAMIQVRENKDVKPDELSEISADELKKFLEKANIKS